MDTFHLEPELDQNSKQLPNFTVKERFLRVFSAIYAKDALKNLSSTESHYFELEIYLEKHSNWTWLEYFIDSSNLVPRACISFFITNIQYNKGDKKAPGWRLWLSQKKTFPVLGYFSDFKGEFYWLVFQNMLLQNCWNIEIPVLFTPPPPSPAGTGGITDFLELSYNQTSANPSCSLDILLSKFITSLKLTTYKYSVNIWALKDIFKLSFRRS